MASAQYSSADFALLDDLPTPSFVPLRYRPGNLGTWSGHLSFANDLIASIRPSMIVELGTHWGEAYFSFCQSVFQNGLNTLCYAIDHWHGEEHAGFYGEEVYQDVKQFNEAHYRGFSYLLRTGFDEAVHQFSDSSIDLLHIDGLHTYEAVSNDFRTWYPKVKPGGIIMIHDIAVRHVDFGVWRLWNELTTEFAQTFSFNHWWGLGVLRKPQKATVQIPFLDLLFSSSASRSEQVRRHYLMCAMYLENTQGLMSKTEYQVGPRPAASGETSATVQIYPFTDNYSEATSLTKSVELGRWQELSFILPDGLGHGPLRIDPSNCVSLIEIQRLTIRDLQNQTVLFSAHAEEHFRAMQKSERTLAFSGSAPFSLLSYDADPFLTLPLIESSPGSILLEISLRIQADPGVLASAFQTAHTELLTHERSVASQSSEGLRQELDQSKDREAHSQQRLNQFEAMLNTALEERKEAMREARILQELVDDAEDRLRDDSQKLSILPGLEQTLSNLLADLSTERALRTSMQQSKSWTLTKPLRDVTRLLKGRR